MPFDSLPQTAPLTQTERDLAILRRAREGIAAPGGWCQGSFRDGEARCAVGWLMYFTEATGFSDDSLGGILGRAIEPVLPLYAHGSLMIFNDTVFRRSTVRKLFDRAIARLERVRVEAEDVGRVPQCRSPMW